MSFQQVADPRFKHIARDPRYKSMTKNDKKILVDKRFKGLLQNKKFSSKPKFDIYGDKTKINNKEYEELYIEEEQEEEDLANHDEQQQVSNDEENDNGDENDQDSEEQDIEEDEDDDDDDISQLQGEDKWEEKEKDEAPEIEEATKRIALQNYDWQSIAAKDLMVLFSSFIPTGGIIRKISVYQSKFGKEKMQEEEEFGPREIFKENFQQSEFKKKSQKKIVQEINELIVRGDDQDLDVDPDKLRKYEKDRLRYYYAVIECDSPKTADALYKSTNGSEFELSNIKIDLRFVPDDMQFHDKPHQECDKLQQQNDTKNLVSRAIGHTNVKLTWEEDIPKNNVWQGKTEEQLDKMDWSEYLGDVGQDNQEEMREFREKLVPYNVYFTQQFKKSADNGSDWKEAFNKKGKSKKRDFDLEITFNTGFQDYGNAILDKVDKKKKSRNLESTTNDDYFIGLDADEELPKKSFKERQLDRKNQVKEVRAKREEGLKHKEELELLIDTNKKEVVAFNPNDRRFQAIYDKPEFAIDPTDRHFKKDNIGQAFQEQIKRKKLKHND